jgi:SAM-dependent methyltransferase
MSATSAPKSSLTEWGRRAAELYQPDYARRYRRVDEEIRSGALVTRFDAWLGQVCDSFGRAIVALDLGCGTGRYFRALRHVRELVGVDVSAAMLAEARHPLDADAVRIEKLSLVQGDFLTVALTAGRFDLVYSIGVLGEHVPFDLAIARRVHGWLVPGGRFAFTAVHRESFSVPRTAGRRAGEWLMRVTPSVVKRPVRERLLSGGLYVDGQYLRDVLREAAFEIESLESHESDVHLHCLCVARKAFA